VNRWLLIGCLVAAACTSSRQLANPGDLRLRTGEHAQGYVVATTEPWKERIDPNTELRFGNAAGAWGDPINATDLHVDDVGAWFDRVLTLSQVADEIEIEDVAEEVGDAIARAAPREGQLERVGAGWHLRATGATLRRWLSDLEIAVARQHHVTVVDVACYRQVGPCRHPVEGDATDIYHLQVDLAGAPLGTWRIHVVTAGWMAPVRGLRLLALLDGPGETYRTGWTWDQIARIEVRNLSGAKTLAVIPLIILASPLLAMVHGSPSEPATPAGTWAAVVAPPASAAAAPLFTTGARVRAIARLTASLDAGAAIAGDVVSTGAVARVRLADMFELGGGVRVIDSRGAMGWSRSTTGVFQVGLHAPLDAGYRFAIPIGLELGGGGGIGHDLRLPWGLRYTAPSGHWFATISPATPQHLRRDDRLTGRWSLLAGVELGASF
jgi:hypothetical protein